MAIHTFDQGDGDGALEISIGKFYGEKRVRTRLVPPNTFFHLTADEARAYAADLIACADALDEGRDLSES